MRPTRERPRCPTCGALRRVEARSYAERAEYLRIAARARRRGMTVAAYRAAVAAGTIVERAAPA